MPIEVPPFIQFVVKDLIAAAAKPGQRFLAKTIYSGQKPRRGDNRLL
jgi:hypothetical protein